MMKKAMTYMMLLASIVVATCCTADSVTDDEGSASTWEGETTYATNTGTLADNNVAVVWTSEGATVDVANNISSLVKATITGGHVCLLADPSLAEEVTYTLSGTSTDGSFYMDGEYKATFVLNGLTLTSNRTDSAAINIRDGKRIAIALADGTVNTLQDRSGGSHKACMMVNGHTEFQGSGTLNLTGKTAHAFWGDEYVELKKSTGTINVKSAVTDGFNINQYFYMKGGVINIDGSVGDDGIAVQLTDDASDEQNGQVIIDDGTLNISVTGSSAKALKSEGAMTINGGTLTLSSSKNEAIESESTLTINGGYVYTQASDDAINSASHLTINGGYVMGYSTGNDGIDANGNMYIKGGTVYAICAGGAEVALDANTEGGYKLYVQGGNVIAIGGLERGASLSQSCYQASSWSRNTWYSLTNGTETIAFKTPSSGGNGLVLSASSQPTVLSGVSTSNGTTILNNMMVVSPTVSGGSSVSLSTYSGGNGMGPGMGPGGRW